MKIVITTGIEAAGTGEDPSPDDIKAFFEEMVREGVWNQVVTNDGLVDVMFQEVKVEVTNE